MNRVLLLLLIFLGFSSYTQAQLALQDSEGQDITNKTVLVKGSSTDNTVDHIVYFSNTGDENVAVFVRKIEEYVVDGSAASFCWNGSCFPPTTTEVNSPIVLGPGETSTSDCFYAELTPFGFFGTSVVTYEFFDDGGSFETVFVTIEFQVDKPTSVIAYNPGNATLGSASPNPASGFSWIPYEISGRGAMQATLVVRNLVGNVVHSENIDPAGSRMRLDTSNLPNGIYIYSLMIDNQVINTKRLVVAR